MESVKENNVGFDKTGLLLVKNKQDVLEYHLYDSKTPESNDINATLDGYIKDKVKIHITIEINGQTLLDESGVVKSHEESGVMKYYINNKDIEMLLFENTGYITTMKIKREDEKKGTVENNEEV